MSTVSIRGADRFSTQRAMVSVRRWFFIPLALALVGVLLGALAGNSVRPSAEALVSVSTRNQDATTMARVMETVVQQLRAPGVFERAVNSLGDGAEAADLRERTRVAAVATSQVLAVQVVANTDEAAIREADAVVSAAIDQEQASRSEVLQRLTKSIRTLMESKSSTVENKEAEQARLIRLGAALADSQSTITTGEVNLEPLQEARTTRLSAGPASLALFCGLGAALLGLAISLVLGVRRGGVRDLAQLGELFPHLPVIERRDLAEVLKLEGGTISTIIVSGAQSSREALMSLREEVAEQVTRLQPDVEFNVLVSELNDTVIRRLKSDPSTLVLVAVDAPQLRLNWLGKRLDELVERAYLIDLPPWP